jgi:hybrid cluster-associated redox disulfide protein
VDPTLLGQLTIAQILARWPAAIPIFLRHGTACVGCVMAPFETLDEVVAIYGLDRARLLAELQAVAGDDPARLF